MSDPGTTRAEPGDFRPAAQVVADSISPFFRVRVTTIEVTLHRYMLPEFLTHRAFSRNSASSRAIPVSKTMSRIATEPAIPLAWTGEQRGMQGGPPLNPIDAANAQMIWLAARDDAVRRAEDLLDLGVHKSIVNRLLEPFMTTTVIVTATDWDNFFAQRCSPLAQDEIRLAAEAVRTALAGSEPRLLPQGDWHMPYLTDEDIIALPAQKRPWVSAARCARVSYLTHAGRRDINADLDLYRRLVDADPPHASPLEHVCRPARYGDPQVGNLRGWQQLRHVVVCDPLPAMEPATAERT